MQGICVTVKENTVVLLTMTQFLYTSCAHAVCIQGSIRPWFITNPGCLNMSFFRTLKMLGAALLTQCIDSFI